MSFIILFFFCQQRIPTHTDGVLEKDDRLGVQCTFEKECAWTYDEEVTDGFHVVNGVNLTESNRTGMMPGPSADSANDANGLYKYI